MPSKLRINAHAHLLPDPADIPAFMKDQQIFWVDDKREFMLQKGWRRPVTHPSFFLVHKLAWMDASNIDHSVVLTLSQLYGNGLPHHEMTRALRFQNDFNARVQRDHPSRFTCGFVVHPGHLSGALEEVERCVTQLGLRLLCLPTHYQTPEGAWRTVFVEDNAPLFALAHALNLAVEIHPYDGDKFIQLDNRGWRFHLVWMLAQCADAYHFYSLLGLPQRYPNMRVCFAHGGQLSQVNLGRRMQGFTGRPDLFEGMSDPRAAVGHPSVFFDSLVHDPRSLGLLVETQGASQVLLGLDDPYPLGEMQSEEQASYPGQVLDLALQQGLVDQGQHDAMWCDNTLRWLCGDDADARAALLARIHAT